MSPKSWAMVTTCLLIAAVALVLSTPQSNRVRSSNAADSDPPEVIRLGGVLRDFKSTHDDFAVTGATGHVVENVEAILGADGRPVYTGDGTRVAEQWRDKAGNPIMPYELGDDPGLPGGHFDVDVFDEPTDKELYHKHKFDDAFDVTYVDLVNDPNLLFDSVIGSIYPNDLRLEFLNPHHGSGTYVFEAGSTILTGNTRDGFPPTTFTPAELTQLRVNFSSLSHLQHTSPGTVQSDIADRNDSLSIRMYDVTTGALVYELAVYHHGSAFGGPGPSSEDACGNSIEDTSGVYSGSDDGEVSDRDSFAQWYRDALGTNQSLPHSISLHRNPAGVYEYLTDDFYPADDRGFGQEGSDHNYYFTFSIKASFTYEACTGQFFEFEGSDDAWVFIGNELALDIGGTVTPEGQRVDLDRLELVDGQSYKLDFFSAHRRIDVDSTFRLRTNIQLMSSTPTVSSGYD